MRADDPSNWHKCILCHDSLWELDLDKIEIISYLYLSTFCHSPFPISIIKMAATTGIKTHRIKLAIDRLVARHMVTRIKRFGAANAYKITTIRIKGWGQTELPLVPNGTTPLAPNGTTTQGQTELLTTSLDDTFLSLFHTHIAKWTFNRKPIGRAFVFTRGMQTKSVECMRWMHRNLEGFSTPEAFNAFLTGCGEYLSLDRDVLSPGRDQRALSPGKWLSDWPEQIRLAGIYLDEKARKITRMEPPKETEL